MSIESGIIIGIIGIILTIVGALIGAGITWGVMSQTIRDQGKRLAAIENKCDAHKASCASSLHEKLNRLCEDVAFLRGKESQKIERGQ